MNTRLTFWQQSLYKQLLHRDISVVAVTPKWVEGSTIHHSKFILSRISGDVLYLAPIQHAIPNPAHYNIYFCAHPTFLQPLHDLLKLTWSNPQTSSVTAHAPPNYFVLLYQVHEDSPLWLLSAALLFQLPLCGHLTVQIHTMKTTVQCKMHSLICYHAPRCITNKTDAVDKWKQYQKQVPPKHSTCWTEPQNINKKTETDSYYDVNQNWGCLHAPTGNGAILIPSFRCS